MTLNKFAGSGLVKRPFVISRTFDAPGERVWKAWIEREHLFGITQGWTGTFNQLAGYLAKG